MVYMKVLRKCVGKPLEVVETDKKYFLECAKTFFDRGVTTERVYLEGEQFIMVTDEDGLMKGLPTNFYMPVENPFWPVQRIVGDVVFIRNKPVAPSAGELWDWEVADVTAQDISILEKLFSPAGQMPLAMAFKEAY